MRIRRALFCLTIIPALVAGMMVRVASAQTEEAQIPSLDVHPYGTTKDDPNGGQWFIVNLNPAETKSLQVRLYNPASVPQTVKLYLADVRFDANGIPEVEQISRDVGTWGAFTNPQITIGPRQTVLQPFDVTAPRGVDPGDHVGAVVIEHQPQGSGNIRSIKRIAVRLYATLPGDARKDFEINKVSASRDSGFFAHKIDVTVLLKNTGRVRLEPSVQVDGVPAKGPELLVTEATERYTVTRPVKFWGGPMRLHVAAQTRSLGIAGPAHEIRVTVWVIPWHLLVLLLFAGSILMLVRYALKRRSNRMQALQADLRRIERLVMQPNGDNGKQAPVRADTAAAIRTAAKQARRAGDDATAKRLESTLSTTISAPTPAAIPDALVPFEEMPAPPDVVPIEPAGSLYASLAKQRPSVPND